MDFARAEEEFQRLKIQFERGVLTEADFRAQLEELMIEDEQGRWWIIGYETGQWYVHDGERWVQQEPPWAAPTVLLERAPYPRASDPAATSSPGRAGSTSWLSALDRKLGRDAVSVLLVSAGWFVVNVALLVVTYAANYYGYSRYYGYYLGYYFYGGHLILVVLNGAVSGLVAGLVLRRTDPPTPWRLLPVVTVGWAAVLSITHFWKLPLGPTFLFRQIIIGLVGGGVTALALKWVHATFRWKHVGIVTLGWVLGWFVAWLVSVAIAGTFLVEFRLSPVINVFVGALWGAIIGAIGSWVMFRQLRGATRSLH